MGKKKTNLYLEEDLVKEAKELGLNVSKICEIALKRAISKMREFKEETGAGSPSLRSSDGENPAGKGKKWRARRDLNPRPPG
ncbi:type II toxin-antitoxin system CcdA family antitoxin [Candidatus Bathyarchaeota archaeon]|nr:type II toxin-antitoxin system CcdA family antitoxin [Candidatus Bathyarchaeota archaeon]